MSLIKFYKFNSRILPTSINSASPQLFPRITVDKFNKLPFPSNYICGGGSRDKNGAIWEALNFPNCQYQFKRNIKLPCVRKWVDVSDSIQQIGLHQTAARIAQSGSFRLREKTGRLDVGEVINSMFWEKSINMRPSFSPGGTTEQWRTWACSSIVGYSIGLVMWRGSE